MKHVFSGTHVETESGLTVLACEPGSTFCVAMSPSVPSFGLTTGLNDRVPYVYESAFVFGRYRGRGQP
jgi:hypothetical protein